MTPNQWFQIHNPQVLFLQLQIQLANELKTPKIQENNSKHREKLNRKMGGDPKFLSNL